MIGGGHGLASLLRGLKAYTHNITAIVTVADDGGSSGELRRDLGVLPPGDIRNCLAALSSDEALLSQLFQYRFQEGAGLDGHSLGNLLITAMSEITGSFEEAVAESGRFLAIYGQVLPSTLTDVQLVGELQPENSEPIIVHGESEITETEGKVNKVWLDPQDVLAYPPTISAILNADLILIGPGSLYTSCCQIYWCATFRKQFRRVELSLTIYAMWQPNTVRRTALMPRIMSGSWKNISTTVFSPWYCVIGILKEI